MPDIKDLTSHILNFRDKRNWKQFHTPKDLAISISLEAGELLEHFQWKTTAEVEEYIKKHKEELADEMADVLNYLLILAHDIGVDLSLAQKRKTVKNTKKYPIKKSKNNNKKYTEL